MNVACALPEEVWSYSVITEQDAAIAAKNVWRGMSIGGTLIKAPFTVQGVSNHAVQVGYGSATVSGSFASYVPAILPPSSSSHQFSFSSSLSSNNLPNWPFFENLALTIQPGFYEEVAAGGANFLNPDEPNPFSGANTYLVCVVDQGGDFPSTSASADQTCHYTARNDDCRGPSGVENDNGATLVVYTGAGTVCLSRATSSGNNAKFGPSVLAPFARVVVDGGSPDVGHIDGVIIAKSVSSSGSLCIQCCTAGCCYRCAGAVCGQRAG